MKQDMSTRNGGPSGDQLNKDNLEYISVGNRQSFAAGAGVERFLLDGWSGSELAHRWTDGECARLKFQIEGLDGRDVLVRLKCKPLIIPSVCESQRVEVRVNYLRLLEWDVKEAGWYEAIVPRGRLPNGRLLLTLNISNPISPAEHGKSSDTRKLGLLVEEIAIEHSHKESVVDWLGTGMDPVGDVLRRGPDYFRAIRHDAAKHVEELRRLDVLSDLANRGLIPAQDFTPIRHQSYSELARAGGARWDVSPANYVLLTLRDAAMVWINISQRLLEIAPERDFGLIDGHYGNFALFNNSRPKWVDIGSIMEGASSRTKKNSGWFGLEQFMRCFVYPLQMHFHKPHLRDEIRELMHLHYEGMPHALIAEYLGPEFVLDYLCDPKTGMARGRAIDILAGIVMSVEYRCAETRWSNYRNSTALKWALEGKYLRTDEDARYRVIIDLVKSSKAKTFFDVGSNDGLFSIMCAREGLSGIATDVDDASLNKLYGFLGEHPGLEITVAFSPFVEIEYSAELVLSLAITHHLSLGQGLSFSQIADRLARVTEKVLITEFMPDGLGGVPGHREPSPNPLPVGYSLDSYLTALSVFFRQVRVIEYLRESPISRRTLIYCEK